MWHLRMCRIFSCIFDETIFTMVKKKFLLATFARQQCLGQTDDPNVSTFTWKVHKRSSFVCLVLIRQNRNLLLNIHLNCHTHVVFPLYHPTKSKSHLNVKSFTKIKTVWGHTCWPVKALTSYVEKAVGEKSQRLWVKKSNIDILMSIQVPFSSKHFEIHNIAFF